MSIVEEISRRGGGSFDPEMLATLVKMAKNRDSPTSLSNILEGLSKDPTLSTLLSSEYVDKVQRDAYDLCLSMLEHLHHELVIAKPEDLGAFLGMQYFLIISGFSIKSPDGLNTYISMLTQVQRDLTPYQHDLSMGKMFLDWLKGLAAKHNP